MNIFDTDDNRDDGDGVTYWFRATGEDDFALRREALDDAGFKLADVWLNWDGFPFEDGEHLNCDLQDDALALIEMEEMSPC